MSDDFSQICVVTGRKTETGWRIRIAVEQPVESLTTPVEQAELFEKLACTVSGRAATIRQNISAGRAAE